MSRKQSQSGCSCAVVFLALIGAFLVLSSGRLPQKNWRGGGGQTPSQKSNRVTINQYEQIYDGMSYSQIVGILGPGIEESRVNLADIITVSYRWQNSDGSNMSAMLQNDKVVARSQFGLE